MLAEYADAPLEQIARGEHARLCQALLTLHAVADEACAHLSIAFDHGNGEARVYRARSRELLARTGSLARIRTFRTAGTGPKVERGNLLLLPWPLRVRATDFRVVTGSVRRLEKEPYGFFEFAPRERLDLDLVDRTLLAARDEVGSVDIVMLPESALDVTEIDDLEALLDAHDVASLRAGVREPSPLRDGLGRNWVHIGVNPRLDPTGPLGAETSGRWFHLRQNKHHRWSLNEQQIYQYYLGGVLHPHIRWYDAMDTPRLSVQFMEAGAGTLTANIVCEDLTQNDEVAEVIRAVGPTFMTAFLLDGPQLASRWEARYASVLADDPGAAVLTLTSYGMARRSRPASHAPSPVIALWTDARGGAREISLEPGAHGVLLTVCGDVATRRSADGRWPADTGASILRRRHPPDPRRRQRLPRSAQASNDRTRAGHRRAHRPHGVGRVRGRSARLRTRPRHRVARSGAPRRAVATLARAPGTDRTGLPSHPRDRTNGHDPKPPDVRRRFGGHRRTLSRPPSARPPRHKSAAIDP